MENMEIQILRNMSQNKYVMIVFISNRLMIPQPHHQFKFVLVGDSSVGKSALLTRFVDDQFHDNLLATIGVDFKFRRIQVDGDEVKIQIWDTAGQETFRSLVSAYYHSADAIIIVYDLTLYHTFESIVEYWVKEAQANNKNNAIIFLIGNKADEPALKRNELNEALDAIMKRHQIGKAFEVSAKTGEKVQESFKEICAILISQNRGTKVGWADKGSESSLKIGEADQSSQKKKCCW